MIAVTCITVAHTLKILSELSFEKMINPLTAGAEYIRFFTQLLPHSVPPFKHGKATM